jgi:hypothetical protein
LPHFEISVKLTHFDLLEEKKFGPYLVNLFLGQKSHFRTGRHAIKETHLFYIGLRIILPIQIQLLDIKNPKIQKSIHTVQCTLQHSA